MQYNDFASLVQLGVGLHAGTALLQLYGELGIQPLARTLIRIRSLFADEDHRPPKELEAELAQLESRYEIFKIQLFNEYKRYVLINTVVAIILATILVLIAYKASDKIEASTSILISALSILPAPITLAVLWRDANRAIRPLKSDADSLERRSLVK